MIIRILLFLYTMFWVALFIGWQPDTLGQFYDACFRPTLKLCSGIDIDFKAQVKEHFEDVMNAGREKGIVVGDLDITQLKVVSATTHAPDNCCRINIEGFTEI